MMTPEYFGQVSGNDVYKYTLENAHGTRVGILNLGGIIQELSIVQNGTRYPLVVSLNHAEQYAENPFQINKQIGRVAGRIQNAEFDLYGTHHQVAANEGKHALHGGNQGLGTRLFEVQNDDAQQLHLSLVQTEAIDGYPNDLAINIHYHLDDDNRLWMRYHATAMNGDSVFDPTMHLYWCLPESWADVRLTLPQGKRIPVDADKLPTIAQPDADLAQGKTLADILAERGSLDDVYQVPSDFSQPVAEIEWLHRYRVAIFSDRNGLILFTASPTDDALHRAGKYNALATEAQTLPNSLHRPEFGDIRLRAGESKHMNIMYHIIPLTSS